VAIRIRVQENGYIYMRKFTTFLLVVLLAGLCAATARADIVPFTWNTTGGWTGNETDLGFVGVANKSGSSALDGTLNGIDLGKLTIADNWNSSGPMSGNFTLTVIFAVPGGVTGDNTYSASYIGTYVKHSGGTPGTDTATISFSETSNDFAFTEMNGMTGAGSFTLALAESVFSINSSNDLSDTIYGKITNAQFAGAVPEPGSIVLFGTMLSGVCLFLRKKKA
jgi:hypothetical protein